MSQLTERIPRRSVFWGTANKSPLADRTGSTRFVLIELPDKKLPLSRVRLDRDAFWQRALSAYRDGFQSYSTDSELDQIVRRNSPYVQSEAEEAAVPISPGPASGGPCLPSSKFSAPLLVSSTLEPGKRACAIFCAAYPGSLGRENTF